MQENPKDELSEVAEIPNKIAEATKRGAVGIIFIKPYSSYIAPLVTSNAMKKPCRSLYSFAIKPACFLLPQLP